MLHQGTTIRSYRIVRHVGSGSFGDVYEATDSTTPQSVALKICAQPNSEYAILKKLNHPNVVAVREEFEHAADYVTVMEFIAGPSLAERLATANGQPGRQQRKVGIVAVLQVAKALTHAHSRSICHRDVKPENILINADGHATLIDWGVACDFDKHRPEQIVGGTLAYLPTADLTRLASIEVHRTKAASPTDAAQHADIFAIGVILHEVAAGKLPFPPPVVDGSVVVAAREALAIRPSLPEIVIQNADIPASLRPIIAACLAEPESKYGSFIERYESIQQLAEDLTAYVNHRPLLHVREGFAARVRRCLCRHRRLIIVTLVCATVGAMLFAADRLWTNRVLTGVKAYALELTLEYKSDIRLPEPVSQQLFQSGYFPDSDHLRNLRADACHAVGVAFLKRNHPAEAVRLLTSACDMQPNNGECLNDLGAAKFEAKNFTGAIEAFNKALKLLCDHAAVLSNRGAAFAAMNQPEQARSDFLQALKIVPDHREADLHLKLLNETMPPN